MVGEGVEHPPGSMIYNQPGKESFLLIESTLSWAYCEGAWTPKTEPFTRLPRMNRRCA